MTAQTKEKKYAEITCTRCGGSGRYSFCQMYLDTCFKCNGSGKIKVTEAYAKRIATIRAKQNEVAQPVVDAKQAAYARYIERKQAFEAFLETFYAEHPELTKANGTSLAACKHDFKNEFPHIKYFEFANVESYNEERANAIMCFPEIIEPKRVTTYRMRGVEYTFETPDSKEARKRLEWLANSTFNLEWRKEARRCLNWDEE